MRSFPPFQKIRVLRKRYGNFRQLKRRLSVACIFAMPVFRQSRAPCLKSKAPVIENKPGQSNVNNFWIIGGGKFGLRAAESLGKKHSLNNLIIVEKDETVCRQLDRLGFEAVCADGIQYLARNLTGAHDPDWIVPAIPLHVAYEWIRIKFSKTRSLQKIAVPNDLVTALPHPIKAGAGKLLISIADFKCPEDCPEPDDICTYTGEPRLMILHEFLKSIQREDIKAVVIRSHQLAAGVGGYAPRALFAALNEIEAAQRPVSLSTACSCHGVMDVFKLSAK
jgi:hypothetical protein